MSVTAARGFVASGVAAGIRPSGAADVAVVHSLERAVGAALWTTNRVQAAPVTVSKRHLGLAEPQAVLINAGCANAATGAQGEANAVSCAAGLAAALALATEEILVLSTGVIGVQLPLDKVVAGARAAAGALSPAGGDEAAAAILTTDSGPKLAAVSRGGFTVGGMAKGAGMIHPRLATMLVVITTDYPLEAASPRRSCGMPSRGASTGSRSTAIAPRTMRSSCSQTARVGWRGPTRHSPRRSTRSAPTWRVRWSPTARGRRS